MINHQNITSIFQFPDLINSKGSKTCQTTARSKLYKQQIIRNRQKTIGLRKKLTKNNVNNKLQQQNSFLQNLKFQKYLGENRLLEQTFQSENKMSSYQLYKQHQKIEKIRHIVMMGSQKIANKQLPVTLRIRQKKNKHVLKRPRAFSDNKFTATGQAFKISKFSPINHNITTQQYRTVATSGKIRNKKYSIEETKHTKSFIFQNQFRPWSPKMTKNMQDQKHVENCPEYEQMFPS